MADQQQTTKPGGYYSNTNKIPTVQKFIENLDKGKKDRDKQIDQRQADKSSSVQGHKANPKGENQREATDPVTGKQVVIEDATKEMYKHVTDPQLSVPNANLGKDTVSCSNHENQASS
jgi:hypothetical protein